MRTQCCVSHHYLIYTACVRMLFVRAAAIYKYKCKCKYKNACKYKCKYECKYKYKYKYGHIQSAESLIATRRILHVCIYMHTYIYVYTYTAATRTSSLCTHI